VAEEGSRPRARAPWSLRRFLVAGMLVWLPILATLWVVGFIVSIADRTLLLLPQSYRPEAVFGFDVPGLGFVFAFLVVLLTGLAVTNLIGRQLVAWWEELMQRIPLVRSVYGGVKSFTESVLSSSNSFRQVVAVQFPHPGVWSLGFVTSDQVPQMGERAGGDRVCVFVCAAPNPTSGFILFVRRQDLIELDMSVDAAMKMVVTCGVVVPVPPGGASATAVGSASDPPAAQGRTVGASPATGAAAAGGAASATPPVAQHLRGP